MVVDCGVKCKQGDVQHTAHSTQQSRACLQNSNLGKQAQCGGWSIDDGSLNLWGNSTICITLHSGLSKWMLLNAHHRSHKSLARRRPAITRRILARPPARPASNRLSLRSYPRLAPARLFGRSNSPKRDQISFAGACHNHHDRCCRCCCRRCYYRFKP